MSASAGIRRTHHTHRLAVIGATGAELAAGLDQFLRGAEEGAFAQGATHHGNVAFVFSGQGPQWWGMGRELLAREPVFRGAIEACERAMLPYADFSLTAELGRDQAESRMQETRVAQPALFAIHVAVAALLRSWGVEPRALVGHSVGEIAAAYVGGALDLPQAARIAVCRGRIMHAASGRGRMIQVGLGRQDAETVVLPFGPRLSMAAHNGPLTTVISGETAAVDHVEHELRERGVRVTPLRVDYAFHSAIMDAFQDELATALDGLVPRKPALRIASTLLGDFVSGDEAFTPAYWARQMREPVEFYSAISALGREGFDTLIEVGPHPVLSSAIRESLRDAKAPARVVATLVRGEPERTQLLSLLATLYTRGVDVAWSGVNATQNAWARLPTYPWQRERLWIDESPAKEAPSRIHRDAAAPSSQRHPLLEVGTRLARPEGAYLWEVVLDPERFSYLADHQVAGRPVAPASLFVEMAIAAAVDLWGTLDFALCDVELERALVLPEKAGIRLQLLLDWEADGRGRLQFFSREEGTNARSFVHHVSAKLERYAPSQDMRGDGRSEIPSTEPLLGAEVYAQLRDAGESYGVAFQGLSKVWRTSPSHLIGEVRAPASIAHELDRYVFHPAVLDACMHLMALHGAEHGGGGFMPTRFARIAVRGRGGAVQRTQVSVDAAHRPGRGRGVAEASIHVSDEQGKPILEIEGARLQYLDDLRAPERERRSELSYEVRWRPIEPAMGSAAERTSRKGWLLIRDGGGLAEKLGELLRRAGHSVALVDRGPRLARNMAGLLARKGRPYGSIVLLPPPVDGRDDPAAWSNAARSLGQSILDTVKGVVGQGPPYPRLHLVTRGAQRVMAGELIDPVQAVAWGLGRSAAAEHPECWGSLVDIDPTPAIPESAAQLFQHLVAGAQDDQVALRHDGTLGARLSLIDVPACGNPVHLSQDTAYLVTGGFGALGRVFADWLVARGARHLVLLGRSTPSARHGTIAAEFEARGARVHHAVADVSEERQVRAALERLERAGVPPVSGVIHAAGVVALQPMLELDAPSLAVMFAPKVQGAHVLDRVFARTPLEFFVLFSSASSVLSSPSLGAYAAANAFMDALAHRRRQRGKHALSVNWGPWADEGMAAGTGKGRGPLALRGMGAIGRELGTSLLEDFLAADLTQVSVLPIAWSKWRAAYPTFTSSPFFSEVLPSGEKEGRGEDGQPDRSGVFKAALPVGGQQGLLHYLVERVAAALQVSVTDLDADASLISLGLDSLMLVELRRKIEGELGIAIRLIELLSDPSIRQLAESLENRMGASA